jgi:hypothetical protein
VSELSAPTVPSYSFANVAWHSNPMTNWRWSSNPPMRPVTRFFPSAYRCIRLHGLHPTPESNSRLTESGKRAFYDLADNIISIPASIESVRGHLCPQFSLIRSFFRQSHRSVSALSFQQWPSNDRQAFIRLVLLRFSAAIPWTGYENLTSFLKT